MRKAIFMYSLFVFGYFGLSTIPVTEVSAAQTIAITSGNNQSTTRGQNFPTAVTFTVTDGGTAVNNKNVSFGLIPTENNHVKMSATASGTFETSLALATNSSGEVTIYVKANTDALYDTGTVVAFIFLADTTVTSAQFTGTITDVLYFSNDTTTRSVAPGTAANTNIGAAVSATHWNSALTLEYSLEGTDASSFNISSTGQLSTNTTMGAVGTTYNVTVKVEEKGSGATARSDDTIAVTINVTNAPVFTEGTSATRSVAENTPAGQNIGTPVAATDADTGDTLTYTLSGTDVSSFDIVNTSGQLQTKAALDYETKNSYSVTVSVSDGTGGSDSIAVTINVTDVANESDVANEPAPPPPPSGNVLGPPTNLKVETVQDTATKTVNAILTWDPPSNAENIPEATIGYAYRYQYNPWTPWISIRSSKTTYTVTGLEIGKTYTFQVQAFYVSDGIDTSPSNNSSTAAVPSISKPKRRIRYECPVGWTRGSVFGNTKKALIYELKVNVDRPNRQSIYELESLAIYVHPEENLENLQGWYLTTGILYNHDHENKFHLTAENSVIDEHGFAHIENPDATPIRMGTLGFIGQSLPSFDYRLYDERGARVDFGISCYKEGGLTWRLWNTEDPRVLRVLPFPISEASLNVRMKELDWNAPFFRTQWTAAIMPDLPDAPAAPSLIKKNIVGTWAALKKQ